MSYETAKYILLGLMCVPVLWLSVYMINSLINDSISIKRRNAEKRKKRSDENRQQQALHERRRRFSDEYNRRRDRRNGL